MQFPCDFRKDFNLSFVLHFILLVIKQHFLLLQYKWTIPCQFRRHNWFRLQHVYLDGHRQKSKFSLSECSKRNSYIGTSWTKMQEENQIKKRLVQDQLFRDNKPNCYCRQSGWHSTNNRGSSFILILNIYSH